VITLQQQQEFIEAISPSLDEAIEWIKHNLNPEDVFDEGDLEEWATDNGFFTEEDDY